MTLPTGSIIARFSATAPEGFVALDGQTIGTPTSGATGRANYDTQALYVHLWTELSDTAAPVSGGRGGSALADFIDNKTLTLPDGRGRTLAGADNGSSVLTGADLGATLGSQTHALSLDEIPNHEHILSGQGGFSQVGGTTADAVVGTNSGSTQPVSPPTDGGPHNNVQPTLVANLFIAL